jgi:hypothetical protein
MFHNPETKWRTTGPEVVMALSTRRSPPLGEPFLTGIYCGCRKIIAFKARQGSVLSFVNARLCCDPEECQLAVRRDGAWARFSGSVVRELCMLSSGAPQHYHLRS